MGGNMFKKFILCFALVFFSANGMTGEATSRSTVFKLEDECGVLLTVLSPRIDPGMTTDEMIDEIEQSITLEYVDNGDCDPATRAKVRKRSESYATASTVLSSGDGYDYSLMDDPPPAPVGDDWVLIGSHQNRLKDECSCLIVVTDVYVWRRSDGNGGYEHAVTTETHVVPLLGCEADEYPGPQ